MTTPAETLSLLSSMYLCKPSRGVLEHWKAALAGETPLLLDGLKKAINDIDLSTDAEPEELVWEYTRLFIGPYKLPCPPWESVYTSPQKLMMQDAAGNVAKLYQEAGLTLGAVEVMPDHIGAELNFLAVLLQKIPSDKNEKDGCMKILQTFLNEHLLKWTPAFTRDMENAAESSFYKALAKATRDVVDFLGK